MPNVASVLKEEIRRLARKEAKVFTKPLQKALAAERKQLAALRKHVAALSKQSQRALRDVAKGRGAAKGPAAAAGGAVAAPDNWRKDTVRSTRNQLGVTQGQFAKLVGVSPISISFWETGRSTPRAKTQVKILALRNLSKSEVVQRLGGVQPGRKKPGRKKKAGGVPRRRKSAGRRGKAGSRSSVGRHRRAGPRRGRRAKARTATRKAA